MRSLIFLIFIFVGAICSCSSSRNSVRELSDSTSLNVDKLNFSKSNRDLSAFFGLNRNYDLSDITIEFFYPDSTDTPSRASPKSIKIANAKLSENSNANITETASSEDKETVNLLEQSSSNTSEQVSDEVNAIHPSHRLLTLAIIAVVLIFIFKLYC